MKALLSIDYTNDFVDEKGALTAGGPAQEIENNIVRLTREMAEKGEYVVFTIDAHDPNEKYHPEKDLFPLHNVKGTWGRELFGSLKETYEDIKDKETVYWIDKRHYSAFSGTDLDIRLRERKIEEIWLTGVVTDICVLHTAIDAYNLGYSIVVVESCVASFNELGHKWALDHFKNTLGAKIVQDV
ncbi:cysteine hydrolase family protein [Lacticigenium naphthae]|uniref:cysteine hydrolase family protein n=1 Tax=Lacticigenium naphthae TaxID=515351 RepID=UPI00040C2141|nr:isochorismatase family cysteine hydrolase [Lacticigenium naphthae]